MPYSVYFKYGSKKYKLPVNPEEIKRTRNLNVETYQVFGTGQVSIPSYCELEEYSFEAEFPSQDYHYVESGRGPMLITMKRCSVRPRRTKSPSASLHPMTSRMISA